MNRGDTHRHLQSIAEALTASRASVAELMTVLAYCFQLARSPDVANLLVNHDVAGVLVRLLGKRSASANVRARCALVLGVMARHATYMPAKLSDDRVCATLKGEATRLVVCSNPRWLCVVRSWRCSRHPFAQTLKLCGGALWRCWGSSCSTSPLRMNPPSTRGPGPCLAGPCRFWRALWVLVTVWRLTMEPRPLRTFSPKAASKARGLRHRYVAAA